LLEKRFFQIGLSLGLVFLNCTLLAGQQTQQDQQKAMEVYMKLMALSENHDYLKSFAGRWNVKTIMWTFPGTPPSVSQNSSEGSLIMGGRFLMMKYGGTMMGQPFEGLQIAGYDNLQKKYVIFWIDNTSTAFYLTSGTLDTSGKVMTETGDWQEPMTGGTVKVRSVTRIISPDEFAYESFLTGADGKEFKTMESHAIRVK
jgi:hypothetical protein